MIIEAGIFGCVQNEKKEVSLGIGWLVNKSLSSSFDYWKDKQFEKEYLGSEKYDKRKYDDNDDMIMMMKILKNMENKNINEEKY